MAMVIIMINLHSTMVLFKSDGIVNIIWKALIYIPLWSYSNYNRLAVYSTLLRFTFHYGPIQICFRRLQLLSDCLIYIPLWSYSNLNLAQLRRTSKSDLHSTMVLFKSATAISKLHLTCIYIPLWSYSNSVQQGKSQGLP